ncbi:hypothetical protein MMC21_000127 [Puttea exsequens]|nr:hypothetical protein [Puttea exsequens]
MCQFIFILASRCRHAHTYYIDRCKLAPLPSRCPGKLNAIDKYKVDNTLSYCAKCSCNIERSTYEKFCEDERKNVKDARRCGWKEWEVAEMRKKMKEVMCQQLKAAHKPLPELPNVESGEWRVVSRS